MYLDEERKAAVSAMSSGSPKSPNFLPDSLSASFTFQDSSWTLLLARGICNWTIIFNWKLVINITEHLLIVLSFISIIVLSQQVRLEDWRQHFIKHFKVWCSSSKAAINIKGGPSNVFGTSGGQEWRNLGYIKWVSKVTKWYLWNETHFNLKDEIQFLIIK